MHNYYAHERNQATHGRSASRVVQATAEAAAHIAGAAEIAEVVNWAYRGKDATRDARAWTGERHLLSGIRTTADAVEETLGRCRTLGPAQESLLVALRAEADTSSESLAGSIHVRRASGPGEVELIAELGMFAVDPDLQGEGIGLALLRAAEVCARDEIRASVAAMWVLNGRRELIDWYRRCGYKEVPGETMPFPPGTQFGEPRGADPLSFARLQKRLL